MAIIAGHVGRVVHQGDNFFVFSMDIASSNPEAPDKYTTVSGHLYGLIQVKPGVPVQFIGSWVTHPKYGRQFTPYGWFPWSPSDLGVERFLNECVEGFSDQEIVDLIVGTFGTLTFETMSDHPDKIRELIPADSPKRMALETALLGWSTARAVSNLSIFLQDCELNELVIRSIFTKFGITAVEVISANPYRLVAVDGFSFAKADRLASRLGISRTDPRRMDGAVLWILKTEAQQGHLFVRRGDFLTLLNALAEREQIEGFELEDLNNRLMEAVVRLESQTAVNVDPTVGVYLPDLYTFERMGAKKLAKFLTPAKIDIDLDGFLTDYEKVNQIDLSDAQREAIKKLIENRVLIVTGLPGTGKTTLIRTIVRLLKQTGVSRVLVAPTGIAAKRLAAVTGEEAGTIHRTFGFNGNVWGFNHSNKFNTGAVIVDEMSMVDQELFYRVLDALHHSTMLVLVGDDAQLPSVGPGNVLRELMSCSRLPHGRLTQIFRQSERSEIIITSHKINKGEALNLDKRAPTSEFQFIQILDEERIVDLIVEMAAKLKEKDANFQVLAPKYEGVVGVHNLNDRLRERLNPARGQKEWKAGRFHAREGDRLMVIHNDYDLNVYNGDMGKLVSVNKDDLTVRIHGVGKALDMQIEVPKGSAMTMLRLAYAITVHKSQGSEFDTVILPMTRGHGRMLQRNLFYTALTRAKKKVWLLGDPTAVFRAVSNDKVVQRNTVFARSITEALDGVDEALANEQPRRPESTST